MSDERQAPEHRWVCDLGHPPVLLAIYDRWGRIEVKVGDRQYIARGQLQATCPRCGAQHVLDLRRLPPRQ